MSEKSENGNTNILQFKLKQNETEGNPITAEAYTPVLLDAIKDVAETDTTIENLYDTFSALDSKEEYSEFIECLRVLFIVFNGDFPSAIKDVLNSDDKGLTKQYISRVVLDVEQYLEKLR